MNRDRYGTPYAANHGTDDSECFCGHYDRSHDDYGTRRCRVRSQCDCSEWDITCDHRCDCPGYEPAESDDE